MITTCRRSPSATKVPTGYQRVWLVQWSFASRLIDLDDGVAQPLDPVRLVHPDQTDSPGERVTSASGDPARHQRVEDRALGHAKARHHRHAQGREDPGLATAPCAPGDLAPELTLRLSRDLHAFVASLLAEAIDPSRAGGGQPFRRGSARELDVGEGAEHQDLLAVRGDLGRAGKPAGRDP